MHYLYLLLNLGSVSIPFLFSFHPKLKFYKYWKALAFGVFISMLLFIPWDIFFTKHHIWSFNPNYLLNVELLWLPIEEWLFFICIPYACVFTHFALLYYFPGLKLSDALSKTIGYLLIALFVVTSIYNHDKWYTFVNFLVATFVTTLVLITNPRLLKTYLLTFLVMLVPFFIVNGILTGSCIENEVVWYNNNENLNMRLFTIPVEDVAYAFSLILLNLYIVKYFDNKILKTPTLITHQ